MLVLALFTTEWVSDVGDVNWNNYRRMSARRLRTLQTKWMDKMDGQNE